MQCQIQFERNGSHTIGIGGVFRNSSGFPVQEFLQGGSCRKSLKPAFRAEAPGQAGGRARQSAVDLALRKCWLWDCLIVSRMAAGWCSNDAKSCHDCIVHWVATICLMAFGVPWEPIHSMFSSLQQATHRLRTGFGDSDLTFRPGSIPFQGCGQGN